LINLIIGKNSNLSNVLLKKLNNVNSLSSRAILNNINILDEFKEKKLNIIFNNFQLSTQLNHLDSSVSYITNTILSTSKVLDYFNDTNINKIIYTSSSSVYGSNILCNENDDLKPMNLHASLKVANEKLIEKYCSDKNIDYTITRVFNMYGGDDNFSIISKLLNCAKENNEITIVNNGNAIRDFIHIDDVVDIYSKLLDIKNTKLLNIGTGNGSSIKSIIDFLYNHNIYIKTNNIFRDELKTSTANNKLLNELFYKNSFIKVEEYLQKELDL
jgi:UDP-glucose 4-epimerase